MTMNCVILVPTRTFAQPFGACRRDSRYMCLALMQIGLPGQMNRRKHIKCGVTEVRYVIPDRVTGEGGASRPPSWASCPRHLVRTQAAITWIGGEFTGTGRKRGCARQDAWHGGQDARSPRENCQAGGGGLISCKRMHVARRSAVYSTNGG